MDLIRDSDTIVQQYLEDNCFAAPDAADSIKKYLKYRPESFFVEVDIFADERIYHEQMKNIGATFEKLTLGEKQTKDIYAIAQKTLFCLPDTKTMIVLGGILHLSPAKLEHFIDGISGGIYRRTAKPVETLVSGETVQAADMPGLGGLALRQDYSESTQEFYDRKDKIEKEYNSAKDDGKITPNPQPSDRQRDLTACKALVSKHLRT